MPTNRPCTLPRPDVINTIKLLIQIIFLGKRPCTAIVFKYFVWFVRFLDVAELTDGGRRLDKSVSTEGECKSLLGEAEGKARERLGSRIAIAAGDQPELEMKWPK